MTIASSEALSAHGHNSPAPQRKPVASTRFLLLRHAATAWNQKQRIQGQRDVPLSERGLSMTRAWVRAMRAHQFQAVLSSDLRRATQTADILADGRDVVRLIDARLREQDWGQWVGCITSQVTAHEEFKQQALLGWDFRPPGGESRREVLARALAALEDASRRWPGHGVLLVAHQGVIKCLVYHLRGHAMLPGSPLLDKEYRLHLLVRDSHGLRLEGTGQSLPQAVEAP